MRAKIANVSPHSAAGPAPKGRSARSDTPPGRRGVALLTAIVCLAVIAIIGGVLVKVMVAQRQQTRIEERKLQAQWLAEAGLERAAAKLADSKDYAGETWQIAATEFVGRGTATVRITVETVAAEPNKRWVKVQADFPADSSARARQSKEAVVQVIQRKTGDES